VSAVLRLAVLAAAIAWATSYIGWIAVPAVAAVAAVVRRTPDISGQVALGAALAWGGLLARHATAPGFGTLLDRLGAVFPAPGWVLLLVTVGLAAALGWSSARLVVGMVGVRRPAA
jgi:hypothetical protein